MFNRSPRARAFPCYGLSSSETTGARSPWSSLKVFGTLLRYSQVPVLAESISFRSSRRTPYSEYLRFFGRYSKNVSSFFFSSESGASLTDFPPLSFVRPRLPDIVHNIVSIIFAFRFPSHPSIVSKPGAD